MKRPLKASFSYIHIMNKYSAIDAHATAASGA